MRDRSPQPQVGIGGEVREDVGGKALGFRQRSWTEAEPPQLEVRPQERRGGGEHDRDREADVHQRPGIAPSGATGQLPGDVEDDDRREEEQVIARRQVLHEPRGRGARQRPHAFGGEIPVPAVQRERHPGRGQHLQVRDVGDA